MSNVISLASRRRGSWREVYSLDGPSTTLQVYVDDFTGEMEIVQMNDEGEAVRTSLSPADASIMRAALAISQKK